MFAKVARFTSRYKIPIVVVWIVLALALLRLAPSLAKVGITDDTQFLPQNADSSQALALLKEKFGTAIDEPSGSALIVVYDPQGLSTGDMQEAQNLHDWLVSREAPANIARVNSIFENAALRPVLVSQDQAAMLINLDLSQPSFSAASRDAVQAVRSYIQSQHQHVQMYVTGPAGVSADALISIQKTIDKATLVTIILVMVLLLIIYRSPVAMLVPLITIGISYLVARGITGYIAKGTPVSSQVDAYLVVTLFGIGTDYCLFMISRFKEELVGDNRKTALEVSLTRIGPVILASAVTVIVALLCLEFSRFGNNRTSGLILAIGVAVTLLAGLTLTPALISSFGRKLLWPAKLQPVVQKTGGFWSRIGGQITRRPLLFAIPIIIILALPYIALPKIIYSANMLSQMPQDIGSVQGYNVVQSHFSTGELNPVNVVIVVPNQKLTSPGSLKVLATISEAFKTVKGVSRVQYVSTPAGSLLAMADQTRSLSTSLNLGNVNQLILFQTLGQNLQGLALQYPGVAQSTNFQQAATSLKQISVLVSQIQPAAPQNIPGILNQIKALASGIADELNSLSAEFNLEVDSPFTQWLQAAYFSQDGTMTRMDVILNSDPYASESIQAISTLREKAGQAIQSTALAGASSYIGGTSAEQADILAVNSSDFLRILGLAIIGILLVMILLLRSVIAPLYMIATVVFNFGATLGIATWLFLDVLKQNSMIYMLPIFVFVILIAVGSDYNIFLVSRIREEARQKPLKDAICNAVANTGGVITSCGIILAGTFATLTTASLQMVFQVGAAIGIGVLIDTFLVRALVIPSLATLAGRRNWWPSHPSKG
jgi:RND superfamily putative drug exporter